jgi:hypothetical protein
MNLLAVLPIRRDPDVLMNVSVQNVAFLRARFCDVAKFTNLTQGKTLCRCIIKFIFVANVGGKGSEPNFGETETVFKHNSAYFRPGTIGGFCENGIGFSFSITLLQNCSNS